MARTHTQKGGALSLILNKSGWSAKLFLEDTRLIFFLSSCFFCRSMVFLASRLASPKHLCLSLSAEEASCCLNAAASVKPPLEETPGHGRGGQHKFRRAKSQVNPMTEELAMKGKVAN